MDKNLESSNHWTGLKSRNYGKSFMLARGMYDTDVVKKELEQQLHDVLKGAQRVPTLLLLNPQQALSDLNLQNYAVLDCEPLHDLKGHLKNLLEILPEILDKEVALDLAEILEVDLSKDSKTGADYRLATLHVLALFRRRTIYKFVYSQITLSMVIQSE